MLANAPSLKTIIEVSGAFPDTIDYTACVEHNVEVLSCSPGFRTSVAEIGLAMALSSARGLIAEHELFRQGKENWLEDKVETDFTLRGAPVGFIGFGQIAQELTRLLAPFQPMIKAYDPWLSERRAESFGIELCGFDEVLHWSRCLFVTASPTTENEGMLSANALSKLADNALVVVLSRAHLVDFDALTAEAVSGRLRIATDVFPEEPMPADHPIRQAANALLSPHRAAAVDGGRQLIGEMIVDDLSAIFSGKTERRLARADSTTIAAVTGVTDSDRVADMATSRKT
jgi:phosphoglycerate dehydrogenase-like enzyme